MARIPKAGRKLWRLPRVARLENVHSVTEFERVFERECALCDRSRDCLALVVFQPSGRADLAAMVEVIYERARVSDVLGFLDESRIGVLLPNTDSSGAPVFIEDVLRELAARGVRCTYDLYVYPESSTDDRRGREHDESTRRAF